MKAFATLLNLPVFSCPLNWFVVDCLCIRALSLNIPSKCPFAGSGRIDAFFTRQRSFDAKTRDHWSSVLILWTMARVYVQFPVGPELQLALYQTNSCLNKATCLLISELIYLYWWQMCALLMTCSLHVFTMVLLNCVPVCLQWIARGTWHAGVLSIITDISHCELKTIQLCLGTICT